MRIGLFTDTYPPEINGVANSTFILKNELVKLGHDVYVITTNSEGMTSSHWEDDGKILRLKGAELKFLYGYVLTSPFQYKALQEVKKLNLDIIHDQTEFGIGIFGHICASQLNIPLVSTYHTTYEDYTHYINFIHSKRVDKYAKKMVARLSRLYGNSSISVIAPSKKTKDMLEKYQIRRDINIIPTGLVLDSFNPEQKDPQVSKQIRESYGFSEDDILFVSVGRLAKEKSMDVVISCFKYAIEQGLPIKLLIVGGGPDYDNIQASIQKNHLEGNVVMSGPLPKENIPAIYQASDAFISASLSETQGMTFIEALASGIPLFARYDEVLEQLIEDTVSGWYYETEEEFVSAVNQFLALTTEERQQLQKNCLEKVIPYSSKIFGEKVYNVYEQAIQQYREGVRIDDVQVKDSYVQLYLLSEQKEDTKLQVTMDDYATLGLRKGYLIPTETYQLLVQKEKGVKAYQGAIRKLSVKDRTRKEMYDWLTQQTDCDIMMINKIIERLEEKGYINDERYCEEAIHSLRASLNGNDRIKRQLLKKGIPLEMIENQLSEIPDTSEVDATQYAQKMMNRVKSDSIRKQRYTLKNKLIQRGFSSELSERVVNSMDFSSAEMRESENLKKCAMKARRKYSSKYSGTQLRNAIYRYCLTQGYASSDIYAVIDEMEWSE